MYINIYKFMNEKRWHFSWTLFEHPENCAAICYNFFFSFTPFIIIATIVECIYLNNLIRILSCYIIPLSSFTNHITATIPQQTIKNLHYKPLEKRSMNTVRVSCVRYCEYQLNYRHTHTHKRTSRLNFCYVALHFFHCFSLNQNLKG